MYIGDPHGAPSAIDIEKEEGLWAARVPRHARHPSTHAFHVTVWLPVRTCGTIEGRETRGVGVGVGEGEKIDGTKKNLFPLISSL